MAAGRVGGAGLWLSWQVEGELGPEDGGDLERLGRLGEADDAVEAVVVGDGERGQAESRRLLHQLLGVRRPVEEAEVRVAVQLGVGDRVGAAGERSAGWYSPRWFDHAGLSPPSALYGRPDSRRSSSAHGTGGFVHPMPPVYRTYVRPLPAGESAMICITPVVRRTAISALAATLALVASTACSSGGGERGSAGANPTVATDPPRTNPSIATVPAPTTTTIPYAVPAVIDAAYVNRVLAGLDAVTGDAVRLVLQTRTIPRDVYDRLKAIYSDDKWLQIDIDGLQSDMRAGFSTYRPVPGNQVTTVTQLITVRAQCIFARVNRDYSAVGNNSTSDTQWVALKPSDPACDVRGYNHTQWSLAYNGYTSNRTQPPDPCAS